MLRRARFKLRCIRCHRRIVDEAGHLAVREDVYGRDARLVAALKNEDRRIADAPIERREASISTRRQAARMPLPFAAPNSFFGGLFR